MVFLLLLQSCGRIGFDSLGDTEEDGSVTLHPELIALSSSLAAPLTPAFSPSGFSYQVGAGIVASEIRLIPRANDEAATILVDGIPTASGATSQPVTLNLGVNLIHIDVQLGDAQQRYQVEVNRAGAQLAYIKASNTDNLDTFGASVALSNDTLVVGAIYEDSSAMGVDGNQADNAAARSGAVYVFRRTGTQWVQEAYLKASNTDEEDFFGASVALFEDTLVVGAYLEDSIATGVDGDQADNTASTSGAAYVFQRTGSQWVQQAYLKASNTNQGDYFGTDVAISGDTLVVGAPYESSSTVGIDGNQADNAAIRSGAVYVFRRTGTQWTQSAYIKASNTDSSDFFGIKVALLGDVLAVGAYGESSSAVGMDGDQADNGANRSGGVYVFRRAANQWSQEAYIKASNTDAEDSFGRVALSGDTLVVGSVNEGSSAVGIGGNQADNGASDSGAVYVFRRTANQWLQEAYIKASNTEAGDYFGESIALRGNMLAVAANWEDGSAVGIDGNQADNGATSSGAVYVFRRTGNQWSQEGYLKASNSNSTDFFGTSVALSDEMLVVGAQGEASSAVGVGGNQDDNTFGNSGAVYLF